MPLIKNNECRYLIECSHGGRGGGECVVDEEEECVLRPQADPLPDEEVELSDRQVRGDQVLLLVQVAQPRLRGLLHDDRHTVRILPPEIAFTSERSTLPKLMLTYTQYVH